MFEIGNTLREARLRRGLDILDCEGETKIRAKYLRAMEDEQFDLLPSPTYVRGFLRGYAEFLDLDGRLVLDEYESRFGTYAAGGEGQNRASDGTPRRASGVPAGPSPRRGGGRRRTEVQLLWLAIGGVMAVALLIWLGVGENTPTATPVTPDPPAAAGVTPSASVPEPDNAASEAPVRTKKTSIVLTGTGSYGCYVEVRGRNAKGRLVYTETLRPGQSKEFKVTQGIWVLAYNPAELGVTIDGKAADLNSSETGTWIITSSGVKVAG